MPPLHEIAHLAHVEVRTPELDKSIDSITEYLGQAWGVQPVESFHAHGTPPVGSAL